MKDSLSLEPDKIIVTTDLGARDVEFTAAAQPIFDAVEQWNPDAAILGVKIHTEIGAFFCDFHMIHGPTDRYCGVISDQNLLDVIPDFTKVTMRRLIRRTRLEVLLADWLKSYCHQCRRPVFHAEFYSPLF